MYGETFYDRHTSAVVIFKWSEIGTYTAGFGLVWFDFCFTALQHILGHFGRGQLT